MGEMGLDFTHHTNRDSLGRCCPQWSYSGFNRFRVRLAAAEGFDLEEMQGFGKGDYFGEDRVSGTRSWDEIATPLKPLLNHSDCDGELTPQECAQIAPRLREVIADWERGGEFSTHYDEQSGLRLADCMEACALLGEKLEFC